MTVGFAVQGIPQEVSVLNVYELHWLMQGHCASRIHQFGGVVIKCSAGWWADTPAATLGVGTFEQNLSQPI